MDNLRKGYSFGIRVESWRDIHFLLSKDKNEILVKEIEEEMTFKYVYIIY